MDPRIPETRSDDIVFHIVEGEKRAVDATDLLLP
jgi:hypothetical protein